MKTVFFDIDTQFDFLLPAGALYAPGAERIISSVSKLAQYASANAIPIVSTVDAHGENDEEFRIWRPHCVAGTAGQQKPPSTLLPNEFVLPSTPVDAIALRDDALRLPQVILEKQNIDCFTNPNLKPLLSLMQPDLCVVYGVVTEICVQKAALGLLALGFTVHLVTDAVTSIDRAKAEQLFAEIEARGGKLTTLSALVS